MIKFTVFGKPQALKRHRSFQRGKFRGQYDPSAGDKSDFLAKAMEHKPEKPIDGPIGLFVVAYFHRPKAHFGRRGGKPYLKDNAPKHHTSTPDADNILKFIGDALNGVFWADDKTICLERVIKKYSDTPRIELLIHEI